MDRSVLMKKTLSIKKMLHILTIILAVAVMAVPLCWAQDDKDDAVELSKKLANPVAALISVPLQYNYDENYGQDDDGYVNLLNIQPVIPFSLNDSWNIITRTIIPFKDQQDIPMKGMEESGLGDITASQFFSPKAPTAGGLIWGVGPVELLPTASHDTLGGEQWGLGPTAVALKQMGGWTVGLLTSHIWSMGGEDTRANINLTSLQPIFSYVTKTKTTLGVTTESSYDWEASHWSVPVIAQVSQLFKIGPQILQFSLGAKYWAASPDSGPEGWGLRVQLTFLFPK